MYSKQKGLTISGSKAELIHRVVTHARGTLSARDAVEDEESPNSWEDDTNSSDSDDSSDDSESSDSDDSLRDSSRYAEESFQVMFVPEERLSNRRGWVGRGWMGRGSDRDPPCIHVIYTYFCAVSNALSQQRFFPRSLSSVYTEWLLGDCAKEDVNILWLVHILFISSFFYQRLDIFETDKTLQNDSTDKDILPLDDKDHFLLYKC